MPTPIVITEPIIEPVTLTEAKAHCRVDTSDNEQDALISGMISAARDYVEWATGLTIHQKTLQLNLEAWPSCGVIELPGATPLVEVVSIKYYDTDEVEHTWGSSEYVTSAGSKRKFGRVAPKYSYTFPSVSLSPLDPIRITYTAGIATASPMAEADATVKRLVLELVARMFEIRESETITDRASVAAVAMQYGTDALISRLKVDYAF
jgi:uncharacterized phiE125 gp8 family phage protein